jgi:hypothetical protein
MSACTRFPEDDQILRYVARDLDEPELSAFEDHLFECDACLARVERYQAAQQVLSERELPAAPTIVASSADHGVSRSSRTLPYWLVGAIAASLIIAVAGLWSWQRTHLAQAPDAPQVATATPPAPAAATPAPSNVRSSTALQVAVLAMVTPPPYLSMTTRGEASAAERFSQGMEAYTRRDWTTAARLLVGVDTAEARFYQGVADLMRGDAASATRSLDAARTSGVQPYARESLFYLGKAALYHGDVPQARAAFTASRDAGASTAKEAVRLLASLAEFSAPAAQ